jgi:hypothetical protein
MDSDDSYQSDCDNVEGIEVENDFFDNPYKFDPVLSEGDVLPPDVQGSLGNNLTQCLEVFISELIVE